MKEKSVLLNSKRTSVLLSTSSNGDHETTPPVTGIERENHHLPHRTGSFSSEEDDSLQSRQDSSSNVSSMRTSSLRSQDERQNFIPDRGDGGESRQIQPMASVPIYENHAFTDDKQTSSLSISELMTNLRNDGKLPIRTVNFYDVLKPRDFYLNFATTKHFEFKNWRILEVKIFLV